MEGVALGQLAEAWEVSCSFNFKISSVQNLIIIRNKWGWSWLKAAIQSEGLIDD